MKSESEFHPNVKPNNQQTSSNHCNALASKTGQLGVLLRAAAKLVVEATLWRSSTVSVVSIMIHFEYHTPSGTDVLCSR
jgi:hypothetical protein